jgi:hypothetical protein
VRAQWAAVAHSANKLKGINMAEPTEWAPNNVRRKSATKPLSPEERVAGRAKVAELIGRLIFKQWYKENLRPQPTASRNPIDQREDAAQEQ